jgi:tetratricopeptide (TPR) repeat protein
MQAYLGYVPVAEGFPQAREAAEKALALDPQLAYAHVVMGWSYRSYDWDWAAADASFRKALELEPGNALAIGNLGVGAAMAGRWSEAIDLSNKSIERDPLFPNAYATLGFHLLAVNRDEEAEAAFRKALELDPAGAFRHEALGIALLLQGKADAALQEMEQEMDEASRLTGLALAHHALGRRGESDAALAALKSKYATEYAYQVAQVHAFRDEDDLAFEWLERAYAQRDTGLPFIKGDRLLRGLVGDPRYKALLRKLKLPE